jgi:hypothetical protein
MAKRKGQKDKQQSTKYYTENERSSNRNLNGYKSSDKWWMRKVFTTSGTHPWLFLTQIFDNSIIVWALLLLDRQCWRVPLVDQELPTLPGHLSSPMLISGIRVTRSLVFCVCFVVHCLSFCCFSFGHCVVCSSSIYWFWLPLWYLQTEHIRGYFWHRYSITV